MLSGSSSSHFKFQEWCEWACLLPFPPSLLYTSESEDASQVTVAWELVRNAHDQAMLQT